MMVDGLSYEELLAFYARWRVAVGDDLLGGYAVLLYAERSGGTDDNGRADPSE